MKMKIIKKRKWNRNEIMKIKKENNNENRKIIERKEIEKWKRK